MKTCSHCGSAENGFTKSTKAKDGLSGLCKICTRKNSKNQYAKKVAASGPRRSYVWHGKTETSEYYIWAAMKDRCLNPRAACYPRYGGRGITVCDEWIKSFNQFLEDVGHRPSTRHTIERINNNGNYEPNNVKWATYKEQARNKRDTRLITIDGITLCASDWASHSGVPRGTVLARLSKGHSVEEALRPLPPPRNCERCGGTFKPHCKSRRFCSTPCRISAANARFKLTRKIQKEITP